MKTYDVIIAGGGFAGVAAALEAARNGLSVLLFDKSNCLGGAAVNCLVNPFMPYHTTRKTDAGQTRQSLSRGIFEEICLALKQADALSGTVNQAFDHEYLKLLLNRMAQQAGIDLLFHTYLTDAVMEGKRITAICAAGKSGKLHLAARYFVDATGDADLAVACGCPTHLGRPDDHLCQPMTLCFRLANVDMEAFQKARHTINPLYQQFQREGKIKNLREDVLIFHTLVDGMLHFNSTRIVRRNPTDIWDVTAAEIEAREQVYELYHFLRKNIDGFQNSQLVMTASEIGVRESRMIDGAYLLTETDLVNCTKFPDAIAAGNYDIDIHNPEGAGTSHYYFAPGEYYTIPYRCLRPVGADNLLVAGRCISSTHEAQASYRIMPIVCCLGQAAGAAVSVAATDGVTVHNADVTKIQNLLRSHNAFLGI